MRPNDLCCTARHGTHPRLLQTVTNSPSAFRTAGIETAGRLLLHARRAQDGVRIGTPARLARKREGPAAGRSARRAAAAGLGERELDGDADVELAVGAAVDEVLGEEVLHG